MQILKEKEKPKKERVKTDAQLKKILWTYFSEYTRRLSVPQGQVLGKCFTCDVRKPIKKLHAGHYVRASAGLATYFDEQNVHAQCYACNIWRDGNSDEYALRLQKKYGQNILNELNIRKHTTVKNFPFKDKIDYYKNKLEELRKVQSVDNSV